MIFSSFSPNTFIFLVKGLVVIFKYIVFYNDYLIVVAFCTRHTFI